MISKEIFPENQRVRKDILIKYETPHNYTHGMDDGLTIQDLRDKIVLYDKALRASEALNDTLMLRSL